MDEHLNFQAATIAQRRGRCSTFFLFQDIAKVFIQDVAQHHLATQDVTQRQMATRDVG